MLKLVFHRIRNIVYRIVTRVLGDSDELVILPVLRGPARGLYLKLDLTTRIESAYWLGRYDLHIVQALTRIIQPGWVVWDCGVYLGFYTAFFARLVGASGKVIGFEPDTRNLKRAQANMKLNHLDNVEFVWAAVGEPIGETDFVFSNNTNSHLPGTYVGGSRASYEESIEELYSTEKIRCISLDQAFEDKDIPAPHLIKLDIEGAEKEAVHYLSHLMQKQRPIIVLELHNPECDYAAWEFAKETGYSLQSMDTGLKIHKADEVHGTILCLPPLAENSNPLIEISGG